MKTVIARHALRYFAAAQLGPLVILQGVWVILATATWSHAYGAESNVAEVMRSLMRGYAWLGGTDDFGRGNGGRLVLVWGKLSLVFYLIDAVLRTIRDPRPAQPRRSVWWWAGLSALMSLLVMGFALWPTQHSLLAVLPLMLLFSALSAGAAAWAVLSRRLVERLSAHEQETEKDGGVDQAA